MIPPRRGWQRLPPRGPLSVVLAALTVILGAVPIILAPPAAADFGDLSLPVYSQNTNGDFLVIGNTLLTCRSSDPRCGPAQSGVRYHNQDVELVRVGPGAGFREDSTTATLTLPGGATVDRAYMYWGANLGGRRGTSCTDDAAPRSVDLTAARRAQVRVGSGAIADVGSATNGFRFWQDSVTPSVYQGRVDVTDLFVGAAGTVPVTVGGVRTAVGATNCHAGWSIAVVYSFPGTCTSSSYRAISIYDGLLRQTDRSPSTRTTLSGFVTEGGPVRVGVLAWEGDRALPGDSMQLGSTLLSGPASDGVESASDNFFNGATDGDPQQPNYVNSLGIDAKTVVGPSIPPGTASVDVTFSTSQDNFYAGMFATSFPVRCFASITKTQEVNDVAVAPGDVASVERGDVITYRLGVRTAGSIGLDRVTLSDVIPAGTEYVAGSMQVRDETRNLPAGGYATLTDAADAVEPSLPPGTGGTGAFVGGSAVFRLGDGANATVGGALGASANGVCAVGRTCQMSVSFRVRVTDAAAAGDLIQNRAELRYRPLGQVGLPAALVETSPTVTALVVGAPDLSLTKVADAASIVAGDDVGFTVTAANGPDGGTARSVAIVDVLRALPGTAWRVEPPVEGCAIAGSTLRCTERDLAPGDAIAVHVVSPTSAATASEPPSLVENTAVASAANSPDVTASAQTLVRHPHLSVVKTPDDGLVPIGDDAVFSITVSNDGATDGGPARAVRLDDALPVAFDWSVASVSSSGVGAPVCSIAVTRLTCAATDLPVAASYTVTVSAPTTPASPRSIVNPAARATADNASTAVDDGRIRLVSGNITIAKRPVGSGTVSAGDDLGFEIEVGNTGPVAARDVVVTDPLPSGPGLRWQLSGESAGCAVSDLGEGQQLRCTRAALPPGETVRAVVTSTTSAATVSPIVNTAAVTTRASGSANATAMVLVAKPVLQLTKTAFPPAVVAGDAAAFVLDASNSGAGVARGAVLVDTLPEIGAAWAVVGSAAGCVVTGGQNLRCELGDLAPGASAQVVVAAQTGVLTPATIDNLATLDAANALAPVEAAASITVLRPALVVSKVAVDHRVDVGSDAAFTVTVANQGTGASRGLRILDVLPAGDGLAWRTVGTPTGCEISGGALRCGPRDLLPGEQWSITVITPTTAASPSLISNTAEVTSTNGGPISATDVVELVDVADLAIAKSVAPAEVPIGDVARFTVRVTNNGPSFATGVVVTDRLPAGLDLVEALPPGVYDPAVGEWRIGDLAAGETAELDIGVRVRALGAIANGATVVADQPDRVVSNNSATAVVTGLATDLSVTKSHVGRAVAGRDVTYSVVVTNGGPAASRTIDLVDELPAPLQFLAVDAPGWECLPDGGTVRCRRSSALEVGASSELRIRAAIPADAASGTVVNVVTVTSVDLPELDEQNNRAEDPTEIGEASDVSISKAVDGDVVAGSRVTYRLDVANAGPSAARGVVVTDRLPSGLTYADGSVVGDGWNCSADGQVVRCILDRPLPSGASSLRFGADLAANAAGSITNEVEVAADNEPADLVGDNTASARSPIRRSADVSVDKTHAGQIVGGTTARYTIAVTNLGPSTADGPVTITDRLPAGLTFRGASGATCAAADPAAPQVVSCRLDGPVGVGPDAAATFTLTASIDPAILDGAAVDNEVTVASPTEDPDVSNNSWVDRAVGSTRSDLSVTKGHVDDFVAGSEAIWWIRVANAGPSVARNVVVTDTLPAGTALVGFDGDGWECTGATAVRCTLATLGPGIAARSTVRLRVQLDPDVAGSLVNRVTVAAQNEPSSLVGSTNTATDTVRVERIADLSIDKRSVGTLIPGSTLRYEFEVANAGPSTAYGATVTDLLPDGLRFVSGAGCRAEYAGRRVTCDVGSFAPAESRVASILVSVAGTVPQDVENTASVRSETADPDPGNDSDTDVASSMVRSDLTISLSDRRAVGVAGLRVTFDVIVTNAGPSDSPDATVSIRLPDGVSFVAGPGCAMVGDSVVCELQAVASPGQVITAITVDLAPSVLGPQRIEASVRGSNDDPELANNADVMDLATTASAAIGVKKRTSATAVAGSRLVYTLEVTSAGPSDARDVVVVDRLPAPLIYEGWLGADWTCSFNAARREVTCRRDRLAAVSSSTVSVVTTIARGYSAGSLTNSVVANSPTSDPGTGDNRSSATVDVADVAGRTQVSNGRRSVVPGSDRFADASADGWGSIAYTGASSWRLVGAGFACLLGGVVVLRFRARRRR